MLLTMRSLLASHLVCNPRGQFLVPTKRASMSRIQDKIRLDLGRCYCALSVLGSGGLKVRAPRATRVNPFPEDPGEFAPIRLKLYTSGDWRARSNHSLISQERLPLDSSGSSPVELSDNSRDSNPPTLLHHP